MKRILFLFVVLSSLTFPQWVQELPYPSGKNLLSISNSDQSTLFLAGFSYFLKSSDLGDSWSTKKDIGGLNNSPWYAVYFIDEALGWISGNGVIFKTMDGGDNWTEQNSNTTDQIYDIQFIDSQKGFAVTGQEKRVLVTTNGGDLWIVKSVPSTNFLECGYFINETTGWVSGQNEIFKTTDAGNSWQKTDIISYLTAAFFINENLGWFVGGNGQILNTIDGGATWNNQISNTSSILTSIFMIDLNTGWIAGSNGTILKTLDSGQNWVLKTTSTTKQLYGIRFLDNNIGFAIGEGGIILKSTNGGDDWIEISRTLVSDIKKSFFIDSITGWLACNDGKIFKSTDSGKNWVLQNTPTLNTLVDIFFINPDIGWAVGGGGTIIHTSDGGSNWINQTSGIVSSLNSITFSDSLNGYTVGINGRILKTTNGGENWINASISSTDYYSKVIKVSSNEAWIAGFNNSELKSILLRTTDNGVSWGHILSIDSLALYGLSIKDFTVITGGGKLTSSGSELKMYRTDNNGSFWNLICSDPNYPAYNYIWDIKITPTYNITAISKNRYFFTSDNGANWQIQSFSGEELNSIQFSNDNIGWITGNNGLLLKNSNYGITEIKENNLALPEDYYLSQNYPNPFNPSTTIKYSIAAAGIVTLKIFDILGREVSTLVNEEKPAGIYEVNFNAASLASGVYFYQLKAGSFVQTMKMLLIK